MADVTQPLTLEQIEAIIFGFEKEGQYLFNVGHYRQLADVMRENERLRLCLEMQIQSRLFAWKSNPGLISLWSEIDKALADISEALSHNHPGEK